MRLDAFARQMGFRPRFRALERRIEGRRFICPEQLPLVCLFQREDGFVFEIDSGFDTCGGIGLGFGRMQKSPSVKMGRFKRFLGPNLA